MHADRQTDRNRRLLSERKSNENSEKRNATKNKSHTTHQQIPALLLLSHSDALAAPQPKTP
jgi:hypothetical protein